MAVMAIITTDSPLRLWHLISAALPVGAFHYSQGLEAAVDQGWVADVDSAQNWIAAALQHNLALVDLPLLARCCLAWQAGDEASLLRWNAYARACRETSQLRAEEAAMGTALAALADAWEEPRPAAELGYTAMFGVLAVNNGIGLRDAVAGYAWSWCENMSLVATKIVPLGHLSGQRMLRDLGAGIDAAVTCALNLEDQAIGSGLPGLLHAAVSHEQQYSRVFRS
jgi:urease accessory protein